MRRSPAPTALLALLALLLSVVLVGCSSGGAESATSADTGDSATGGGEAGGPDAGGAGGGADSGGGAGGGGAPAAPDELTSLASGRVAPGAALIRTGELTVRVDDVGAAADEAGRLAAAAGGRVEAEERSAGGGVGAADASAVVVLRVPPRAFDATLRRLAELGDELDRRLGTSDVTEQVVDLDSRTATQRASVARVRALLDEADDLGDVVQLESELTRRTADLESLEARLAALQEQVDLSTITVRLHGEDGPAAAGGLRGFSDGLAAGWQALTAVVRVAAVTVGALLPFTPLAILGGALLWRSRSRRAPAGQTHPRTAVQ